MILVGHLKVTSVPTIEKSSLMQIIPVLDLLKSVVVRGVAGKRGSYQPVESCLSASTTPLDIAIAFREQLGLNTIYIADLDAILHQQPNLQIISQLSEAGFETIVDAGLQELTQAETLLQAGATTLIAGLETIPSPQFLQSLSKTFGKDRVIFSLDLFAGSPMGKTNQWQKDDPFSIGCEAVAMGIERIILLDLKQVGVNEGMSTLPLCEKLLKRFPYLNIITGGGVRSIDDLQPLVNVGVSGLLIASALHNGTITKTDIQTFFEDSDF
ncbi:hypothetical protein MNBD_PLANCTO02-73 [hydrothermal vent metagenome]|uniref:Phosphoribosylformimino-5-aminoimidazole carboxamide ribotide isomerase n=1 Tax=hydrothermal vent metagenome TaxID=652676 RepID=A0A3B1E8Q2_9ZZZZ